MNNTLATKTNEVNILNDKLSTKTNEVNILNDKLSTKTNEANILNDKLSTKINEVNVLNDTLATRTNEVNLATQKITSLDKEIEALKNYNTTLDQLKETAEQVDTAKLMVENKHKQLSGEGDTADSKASKRLQQVGDEIIVILKIFREPQNEIPKTQILKTKQLGTLRKLILDTMTINSELEQKLSEATKNDSQDNTNFQDELRKLQEQFDNLKSEVTYYQKNEENINNLLKSLGDEKNTLENNLLSATNDYKTLQELYNKEVQKSEKIINEAQKKSMEKVTDLEGTVNILNEQMNQFEGKANEAKNELES